MTTKSLAEFRPDSEPAPRGSAQRLPATAAHEVPHVGSIGVTHVVRRALEHAQVVLAPWAPGDGVILTHSGSEYAGRLQPPILDPLITRADLVAIVAVAADLIAKVVIAGHLRASTILA